jgi:hypothetical protein
MNRRYFALIGALAVLVELGCWIRAQAPASQTSTLPMTAWGDPDLSGVWNNGTTTPWERPKELAGKEFLTEEEAIKRDATVSQEQSVKIGHLGTPPEMDERGRTVRTRRTSLITDPPDGHLPPLSAPGQKRMEALEAVRRIHDADSWLDRSLTERCLLYRGLPPAPTNQNNNYAIVQTPQYVAILQEHIHDVRVIYTDGRSHLTKRIRQWLGDSRAVWEGRTLVVTTTNFYGYDKYYFGIKPLLQVSDDYEIVERFTRVLPDMIDYTFTVTDPKTFSRPFSGSLPMTKVTGVKALMFESACHEGNYGMTNILTTARNEEARLKSKHRPGHTATSP